ncbi:terminase small subunit [Flavobacterium sp. MFBS3-15]|uniref:terminase small subunit n=1 Tax=Flavobacterium sp. MFBS3-15 TaxID=2989816 RepID=UPI002235EFC1|nr:terminase small subunit [Flavobacterium sp. MFBS3-15]MCW4470595.1 terminase small subunit [Flavobacterium sp. MFBS3-15]
MKKLKPLNIRQENFCHAYVRLGSKSQAYQEAYSLTGENIAQRAGKYGFRLAKYPAAAARIAELQQEKFQREVSIDHLLHSLAAMLRFDIADLYDENGCLKNLKDLPKETRLMIQQFEVNEVFTRTGSERTLAGFTKKVKTYSKTDAIEKLMKHLGGYEKDNRQSQSNPTLVMINLGDGEGEV